MDLRQLETFVRVAELGSFTRASIVLQAAQPALSKQIRKLEVELGQTLFSRHGRGIVLTEETRRRYPFQPGSGEFNSVPGKILTD